MEPDDVIATVKNAVLRGRGGAGFPTGVKWSFIPQDDGKPHYLTVNADESEPGTCKDIPLMMANPHVLIEGIIITCYAIRAEHAFIYVRGEVLHVVRRLQLAVAEAYEAGYLGKDILGTGFDLDVVVHAGAGAYICGEETALLTSLEGYRGLPRNRPPFPAVEGLYASPTVINNVESISSVPSIIANGSDWFAGLGTEKSKGYGIFSLSGHVKNPGQYEAPLGITLRELIDLAGGMLRPGTRSSSGRRAARRPRCSPTSTWTSRSTSRGWAPPGRCSAPGRCSSSTTPPACCGPRCAGPSSTSTSPAASARRAARAPTGWSGRSSGSSTARAPTRTWRRSSTWATTSSAARSAPSATRVPVPISSAHQVLPRRDHPAPEGRRLPVRPGRFDRVGGVTR